MRWCIVLILALAVLPLPAMAQSGIEIDLSRQYTTTLRQGLVNGPDRYRGRTPVLDHADRYISALKFSSWRMSGLAGYGYGGDTYKYVVTDYQHRKRFGTAIVLNMQDAFNAKYGKPVTVGKCRPWRGDCFVTFESLRAAWNEIGEQFLKDTRWAEIDYIDLLGEPDLNAFKNVSREQIYILLKDYHALVKKYRPRTKIVAPSMAGFGLKVYQSLVGQLVKDNLRLDAISWHELGDDPDAMVQHVNSFRTIYKTNPQICQPSCPEIHINEYQGENTMFLPGYTAGWLAQLEAMGVHEANRACWGGDPGSPIPYESCWQGFSGLLTPDSSTPQPIYWVYKFYADLNRTRFPTRSTTPKIAALSGPVGRGHIGVLAGNYGGLQKNVTLTIRNYPARSARIDVYKIPSPGNRVSAMPKAEITHSVTVPAMASTLTVTLPVWGAGDAYWLNIAPN